MRAILTALTAGLLGLAVGACVHIEEPAAAGRIEEARFVPIGGIDQWVTIRGDDRGNSVLLIAHGGPADILSPYIDEFAPYEREFVVVHWDQRGAGRTFGRYREQTPDVTLDRIVADGLELSEYLRGYLDAPKLLLLGHSWGSVVGVEMAEQRPDLFAAYVGTGQVASWNASILAQYEFLRDRARETNNADLAALLDGIGEIDPQNPEHFRALNGPLRRNLGAADGAWLGNLLVRAEEVTTPEEFADAGAGMEFSGAALFPAQLAEDLYVTTPRLEIPLYVVQGADDLFTPTSAARDYFEFVDAPYKEFIVLEGAGHFAIVTDQQSFVETLRAIAARVGPAG